MRSLMLVASLIVAPGGVAGQTQPLGRNLHVGLFGYRPDGTVSAHAVQTQLARRSFVWVSDSGCGVGAGPNPSQFRPSYAWTFSGKVLDLTAETAVIRLDWQRVIDRGQPVSGPEGSLQLTLNAGDRVLVDSVVPHTTSGPCWVNVGFEARYRADPEFLANVQVTGTSQQGIQRRGEADIARTHNGPRSSGSSRSVRSTDPAATNASVTTSIYDVHLWLVRSAPGRPEESQYRHMRVASVRSPFVFAPLTVETAHGPLSVTVGGSLEARAGTGGEHLALVLHRNVPQGDGKRVHSESLLKMLPKPDEVASVDMPPLRVGDQLFPDRLSLRVRIEPR